MKKKTAEHLKDNTPSFIGVLGDYLKTLFSFEGKKDLIDNASGSLGLLVKLLGKPAIDNHFEKVKDKMLDEYGFHTYIQSAFRQAARSVQYLKDSMVEDKPLQERLIGLQKDFNLRIQELEKKFTLSVFQPRYHPAIQMIREIVTDALIAMELDQVMVNDFRKHYNDGIEATIAEVFGDNYVAHKEKIKKYLFQENETKLLLDIIDNKKIGFAENEDLKYEETYGYWSPLGSGFKRENRVDEFGFFYVSLDEDGNERQEPELKKVEALIDEYFSVDPDNHVDKILFLIADFGKGKSVFLKKYAAQLAQSYLNTGDGLFPVYFNLRSFANYRSDTPNGVLEDFLLTKYAIRINSDYFKQKRFMFLVDSLDESCDLTKSEIEKVISSVKRIQNLDKAIIRNNRIIITSRPFDDVLINQVYANKPYEIVHDKVRNSYFVALFGFQKEQFNDWINCSLLSYATTANIIDDSSFVSSILNRIKNEQNPDVYEVLHSSGTLSESELQRPIFAYMIYQLILNNIAINSIGKVGIYLSFLNLLTKEAKYVDDPGYKNKLQDQFEARNVLHHIAALWVYEREKGKQGVLKKADICRLIGGFTTIESDIEVFDEYRRKGFSDIQFLSHSYFGENDNRLHFQHQSFAEILLAEYYLKVFICCALDRSLNLSFVISMLKIGSPTEQCIEFFVELLLLLKETVGESPSPEVIEKRKLLTPLLASISIDACNRQLNSQALYYKWYELGKINSNTRDIPQQLLLNWVIDQHVIDSMVDLCFMIVSNNDKYVLSRSTQFTPLIKEEVTMLHEQHYSNSICMEKHLALIAGNRLFNTREEFFVRKFSSDTIVDLLRSVNKSWLKKEFKGIKIDGQKHSDSWISQRVAGNLVLNGFDFSDAIFDFVNFLDCDFRHCLFDNASLQNVIFEHCRFFDNDFGKSKFYGNVDVSSVFFLRFGQLPPAISLGLRSVDPSFELILLINNQDAVDDFFEEVGPFLKLGFKQRRLLSDDVFSAIHSNNSRIKEAIIKYVISIENAAKFA
ncbi:MAG: NACHT domain-containing protein [Pseudobacter sp.]|uniref:NACHT domain-containing protein n=1 Tax=Pseudobacter sp. TaxID=2045420 RepID=UPI003F7FBBD4